MLCNFLQEIIIYIRSNFSLQDLFLARNTPWYKNFLQESYNVMKFLARNNYLHKIKLFTARSYKFVARNILSVESYRVSCKKNRMLWKVLARNNYYIRWNLSLQDLITFLQENLKKRFLTRNDSESCEVSCCRNWLHDYQSACYTLTIM